MARIESEVGTRTNAFMKWIDDRFPMTETMRYHVTDYYASKNFNWWYIFGVLAMVVLVIQLLTGIFLTMNYKPSAVDAFASVEYIMRDVEPVHRSSSSWSTCTCSARCSTAPTRSRVS